MGVGEERLTGMTTIGIDVSPLGSGDAVRGIGTYVYGLIEQLEKYHTQSTALRYLILRLPHVPLSLTLPVLQQARQDQRVDEVPTTIRRDKARWVGTPVPAAELSAAITKQRYDLYHATVLEDITVPPHAALVATLYDLIPIHYPRWDQMAKHPRSYLTYRRQLDRLRRADHVIAISDATKRDAIQTLGIAAEKISVVHLAVSPDRAYLPSAPQFERARASLGINDPYFLTVAASDPHKNMVRVVEAFAAFRRQSPSHARYQLLMVGTWAGQGGRAIQDTITRLNLGDQVRHLTGLANEVMAPLYFGATALVFPSLMEGFGLPILEAMQCGTAVITSNCSSMPEVGGDAALYVDPLDTAALTAALSQVADDPAFRASLLTRSAQRVQRFQLARMGLETMMVYRQILGKEDARLSVSHQYQGA